MVRMRRSKSIVSAATKGSDKTVIDAIYDARKLGYIKMLILSLQHLFVWSNSISTNINWT